MQIRNLFYIDQLKFVDLQIKMFRFRQIYQFFFFFQNNILHVFSKIQQFLTTNSYTQEEQQLIACPTPEQVSVLLSTSSLTSTKS